MKSPDLLLTLDESWLYNLYYRPAAEKPKIKPKRQQPNVSLPRKRFHKTPIIIDIPEIDPTISASIETTWENGGDAYVEIHPRNEDDALHRLLIQGISASIEIDFPPSDLPQEIYTLTIFSNFFWIDDKKHPYPGCFEFGEDSIDI